MKHLALIILLSFPATFFGQDDAPANPQTRTIEAQKQNAAELNVQKLGGPAITAIRVGPGPQGIVFTPGAIWAAWGNDKTYGLSRIDSNTLKVVVTIETGKWPVGVAAGEGGLWVVNHHDDSVTRVDPETNSVVATIRVGRRPLCIAVGEGSVWVTNEGSATISKIDPHTNEVSATIPVGLRPSGIVISDGAVWVANFLQGSVYRIDAQTNALKKVISVKDEWHMGVFGPRWATLNPNQLVAGQGSIWVTAQDQRVLRIDPQRNKIVTTIAVPPDKALMTPLLGGFMHVPNLKNGWERMTSVPGKPTGIAIAGDIMWVADWEHDALWKVDIPTGKTFGLPVKVGRNPLILGPGNDGTGAIWVANAGEDTIMQIRPTSTD